MSLFGVVVEISGVEDGAVNTPARPANRTPLLTLASSELSCLCYAPHAVMPSTRGILSMQHSAKLPLSPTIQPIQFSSP